jgi:fused signal recognition particle receptor
MSFWNQLVDRFRDGEEIDWEPLLIEADLGVKLATELVEEIKEAGLTRAPEKAEAFLREKMVKLVRIPPPLPIKQKPEVILLIGVNGSGKTTTAAKLGARLEIPVTSAAPGTDPASVAVRSLLASQESNADLLIIDTAGRQANKRNLLLELGKIKKSLQKKVETVPHHTWLVADGTTGTGVLSQAKEFHEAIGLTGLIVTKLDGSARGGMVAAVRAEVGLPTYYLGRGEKPEDLKRFNAAEFVEGFFAD